MATLKSTLKLESTSLFPSPLAFTVVNNNSVDGTFSGFQTVTLSTVPVKLNMLAINGTALSAYCYFKNESASVSTAYVARNTGAQDAFLSLSPGDVSFISYGGTAAAGDLYAYTTSGTATLTYFIGEKN